MIAAGTVLEYFTGLGGLRRVLVTGHGWERHLPVFDGILLHGGGAMRGDAVWGYEAQITKILREPK